MLVRHWMTLNPITVTPEEDIKSAYSLLKQRGFRQFPVVKGGELTGIVTHRDLIEAVALRKLTVAEIMRYDPVTVSANTTLEEAAQIVRDRKINSLPVVSEGNRLVGIITITDILDGLLNPLRLYKKPVRVKVKISEGADICEVFKLLQMTSAKVASFVSSVESNDTFFFWLVDCKLEELDKELEEKKLNVEVTYSKTGST
ncbi:MAG TPA: CBS domain-containing protein [Thermodesulfobacteriota bacterium]|nr:CBS domain-containing protein [Thermodesulfobacteriota bacterium]